MNEETSHAMEALERERIEFEILGRRERDKIDRRSLGWGWAQEQCGTGDGPPGGTYEELFLCNLHNVSILE